ncbi:5-oxoprolinase subunit PxpB [Bacillus alveayuensis]|uniref:Inhibitor of KinA n=1 Tax=Aeribacillus alveayuensis TaxID=279215 RepID=A0ABT9VPS8_9BACI|nr:5-oxoprolinase subunit PxpB [Bacillus alveayuensis]MDQ0162984.1 inhibitor of KinA [Bacillus alveayuensis]
MEFTFHPLGDKAIQLQFSHEISEETIQRIRAYSAFLKEAPIQGVIEWIPAYTTLTILYEPEVISYEQLKKKLEQIKGQTAFDSSSPIVYEIPTYYGGEFGPDLSYVAQYNNMTEKDVIKLHTSVDYLIYMMGFAPGFPYLGGMPNQIATPRLEQPRKKVSAGSVGIAGEQTGIYPLDSPGGWRIIGKTPIKLYDPRLEQPILLSPGHYLRFKSITFEEYAAIEKEVQHGTYQIKTYAKEEA